ncbi:type II toxin-antitoxin system VapC family toxin [Paenarthrobacter sp. PH39-S1]|uniref:type II toxin-antitoxin system VapC family toxin n=1 Tax=Paenarthrobacter sp. PH39-S1 TaxID=3046204 RepID=UPI0024B8B6AF|nr:type II toxin-antitoxin system VapC family toxin [Paenarthrobacter sp. PH39-S1]MDJ0355834.1 type II toxin-antitoxin system VapC family toxin [Paenarthrobacter sp. PH39-S1]
MIDAAEIVVVDASVLVDLLAGTDYAAAAATRLRGTVLHAPAHLDAEVLSALGQLHRAGKLSDADIRGALEWLATLPLTRHLLGDLLTGAWEYRDNIRLADALYVRLASRMDVPLLTTDRRLARACPIAEAISR